MSVSTVIIVGCGKQNVPVKKFIPRSLDPVNVLTIHGRKDLADITKVIDLKIVWVLFSELFS